MPKIKEAQVNVTAPSFLMDYLSRQESIERVLSRFKTLGTQPFSNDVHLENVANTSVKMLVTATMFQKLDKPIVLLCPDAYLAKKYHFELTQFLDDDDIHLYPAEEYSPYDLSSFPVQSLRQQIQFLKALKSNTPGVYLITPKNLLLRHLSLDALTQLGFQLEVGQEVSPETLTEQCLALGYLRTSLIMDPGEFSSRGDIFDLYPVSGDPVRIEFFGDTVESIRLIDVENQRSVGQTKSITAVPASGIVLNSENKKMLAAQLNKRLEAHINDRPMSREDMDGLHATIQNQIQTLEQEFLPDGIDYYGPMIHAGVDEKNYVTIMDYLSADMVAVVDDWTMMLNNMEGLSDRLNRQYNEGLEKARLLDMGFCYHLNGTTALGQFNEVLPHRLFLDTFPIEADGQVKDTSGVDVVSVTIEGAELFKANMETASDYMKRLRRDGTQVVVTSDYPQRVIDACKEWDVPAVFCPDEGFADEAFSPDSLDVLITRKGPFLGFVLPEEKLANLTDAELFGRKQKKRYVEDRKQREEMDVIDSINDLREGDYVVHVKHGIGQFSDLCQINIDGERREYLTISYANGDKLHVPVEQVNMLSRYRGAGEAAPKLSKMGGIEWGKVKSKVKKSIQVIAKDLQALYAARAKAKGYVFDQDSPWQVEMEEAFPYTETPDQWQAILDTKGDMETDKPMDRLICGDVGFGKTEVALRAIFKAVLSGKQVAFLVPTTILAQQHFNTLTERLQAYPVKVGLLSRFRSAKEQRDVVARLQVGECDVAVGTHRLLQKDVRFKDLGLVVIDEEQRFGVSHKEKLKQLRNEVDVLTLSATPIPRTLYMALSGIREMSLINTAPTNRAPIKTFVGPYNPSQIRMAILQEIDRGGQVFFLHNRVKTIYQKLDELQALIPEVRFAVGHGQMNERDLENVMLDFAQHQSDVLLCTTIIESGLDIPNVNTIVIDRADRFGLAQLYQIRGRVGRSETQAYAYCYYDPDRELTTDATDRLRAIREFTTLGSGYQIALRDLEIRGVGNVLGSEQHGHMVAVGFDLYCQMLEETIQEVKGEEIEEREESIIDLNVTALIPDEYVGDRDVKMMEYKRLARVDTPLALEIIEAEWKDRFGDIPEETIQLMNLVRIKLQAMDLHIPQIRSDEDYIRVSVPYSLQEWMYLQKNLPAAYGKKARWVPGVTSQQGSTPTLLIKHLSMTGDDQVEFLMAFLKQLNKQIKKFHAEEDAKKKKKK